MKKKYLLLIALTTILISLLATACPNNSANTTTPAPFFPVQKSGFDQMLLQLEGELEMDDGYLRVEDYLLIWPHGFSVRGEGDEIQVIDSDGQVAARVGGRIKVSGGEVPAEIVEKYIGQPLPENCPGPYWIVSRMLVTLVTLEKDIFPG